MLATISSKAIVWGLLHSVWQSAALLVVLYVILAAVKDSKKRYAISLGAFVLLCVITIANLAYMHNFTPDNNFTDEVVTNFIEPEPLVSDVAPSTVQTGSPSLNHINWYNIFLAAWAIGAAALLLRLLIMLTRGSSLIENASLITDDRILKTLDELTNKLKVSGKVVLMVSDMVSVPLVAGIIQPVILLPICILSEHSLEQVKAALAHELIHIKRFDPFINLLQIMVESILFFNPAVWLVSRQIRIEREAVCDYLAISHTGNAKDYVELLLGFIKRVCPEVPQTALAFAKEEKPSVDRVRRILQPGYKPAMKFGILPFLAAGLICIIFATVTWNGSETAFRYLGEKLSKEEKIEKIAELSDDLEGEIEIPFSGFVVDENDKPITDFSALVCTENQSIVLSSGGGCGQPENNKFATILRQKGLCEITVSNNEYAQTRVIIQIENEEPIEDIKIVLRKGFPSEINLIDTNGKPVSGAKIAFSTKSKWGSSGYPVLLNTDENGNAIFKHSPNYEMVATFTASGYELLEQDIKFEKDKKQIITLFKSEPGKIYVTDFAGKPIPNPKVWTTIINKNGHEHHHDQYNNAITGDANGLVIMDTLVKGYSYTIAATADGYGYAGMQGLVSGNAVKVKLPKATLVEGVVKGKGLEERLMKSYWQDGKRHNNPAIYVNSDFSYDGSNQILRDCQNRYENIEVEVVDGVGFFTIDKAYGDELAFSIKGNKRVGMLKFDHNQGGKLEYFIDLDDIENHKKQKVIITLRQPQGMPAVNGRVMLAEDIHQNHNGIDVVDSKIETEVDVPAKLRIYTNNQNKLTGYLLPEDYETKYEINEYTEEPFEFSYGVVAAGCIIGKLLDTNGQKASGKVEIKKYDSKNKRYSSVDNATNRDTGKAGDYIATPLQVENEYIVTAMIGNYLAVSKPIEITQKKMIAECNISLGKTTSITGRVLGTDGSPAAEVEVRGNLQGYGRYDYFDEVTADKNGKFEIKGINPDKKIEYHVAVNVGRNKFTISKNNKNLGTLRIPQLRQKTITVIDKFTRKPIAGVKVRASSQISDKGMFTNQSFESVTDADGKCTVDILKDANEKNGYSIYVDASRDDKYRSSKAVQNDVIELRPLFGLSGKFIDGDTGEPVANLAFKFQGKYDSGTTYNSYRFDSIASQDGTFTIGRFHPENIKLLEVNGYRTEPANIEFHFDKDAIERYEEIKVYRE